MLNGPDAVAKCENESRTPAQSLRERLAVFFGRGHASPPRLDLERLSDHMIRDLNAPTDFLGERERRRRL